MLQAVWSILLALAPWLLLGMAIAGVLHVALPRGFVHRQLAGPWGVVKAVALGVPLPLCSCGVIPAGLGLKKDGASNGAAVGFLISTPQTGVDSILVSSSFLGWPFAIFKVVSAAVTGAVGGWLSDAVSKDVPIAPVDAPADAETGRGGLRELVDHALMILRTIWHWIVIGVVASAAIEVFVPDGFFAGLERAGAIVPVLAVLAVSLPLYVCATASVPIAAALVAGGMPTGAALVFLMAGPATNVATIGAIYRSLGARVLAVYLSTIIVGSVGFGMAFDFLLDAPPPMLHHEHGEAGLIPTASAILLLLLIAWFAVDDGRRWLGRMFGKTREESGALELGVDGMSCNGCVSKLERALRSEPGVTDVVVTLEPGKAVIRGSLDVDRAREVIEHAGFAVVQSSTA